ncbi:MAG: D-alanine--D-alanine ligase [Elusimicrobia bacterium]|nr:D-alanine--D-alanine ligase [Elusimicrobiota bacterium]
MKIKKIGVIYGGKSSEREISLKTGAVIAAALKKERYTVVLLDSAKKDFIKKLLSAKIDFAFIALHGPGGEDGTMQGLLEISGIPYSGSGVLASALSMNKIYSKRIFESNNILTPRWCVVSSAFYLLPSAFKFPVVVKPAQEGSAIGVTVVRKKPQFRKAVRNALKYNNEAIIEEYINGKEITVAVLGNSTLTPIEIVPKNEFYDFYSKYASGGSRHLIPARLPKNVVEKAGKIGLLAHSVLGCRAMSRVDMIVDKKNNIYVLEVNTIPGMTDTSLFPDAAKFDGIFFGRMLKKIIEFSVK